MERRDFLAGATALIPAVAARNMSVQIGAARAAARAVHLEDGVLTLQTIDLLKGPDGDTFNRLTWTRLT